MSYTLTLEDCEFFMQNLLEEMCQAEDQSDDIGNLFYNAKVENHKNITSWEDLRAISAELIITFFADPNGNTQSWFNTNTKGKGYKSYYLYCTMAYSKENQERINRVANTLINNIHYNQTRTAQAVPSGKTIFCTLNTTTIDAEPVIVNEFEGNTPNYITAVIQVTFPLQIS